MLNTCAVVEMFVNSTVLRTVRINLVQDNTEIIDKHKNWNIILFKEALKFNLELWIEGL